MRDNGTSPIVSIFAAGSYQKNSANILNAFVLLENVVKKFAFLIHQAFIARERLTVPLDAWSIFLASDEKFPCGFKRGNRVLAFPVN